MTLSIIILNYKSREMLKLCLKSIERHLSIQISHEILVIDSAAETITAEMMREEFSHAQYFPQKENVGYARGINFGLSKAGGRYFLILNPDIVVTAGAIEQLIKFLDRNPEVGLAGPQLLNFDGQRQNSRFRFYRPWTILYRRTFFGQNPIGKKGLARFNLDDQDPEQISWPDWLMGSALITRREALEKVGYLDKRFFLYFEDVDWAKRFWENGYKVAYLPQAVMFHYLQRRSRAGLGALDFFLRREARWHLQSAVKYFLKHGLKYKSGPELMKHA